MSKDNVKNAEGHDDSPESTTSMLNTKQINDTQSLMNRVKNYAEDMVGILKTDSLGVSSVESGLYLQDLCFSIESYINIILKANMFERMFDELRQVKKTKYLKKYYDMLDIVKKRMESGFDFPLVIQMADICIEIIYGGKKIHQKDKFEKS